MGVRGIIGASLRPGANLIHVGDDTESLYPVDVLTALGVVASRFSQAGATTLHARIAGDDAIAFRVVVQEACGIVFSKNGWTIEGTKRCSPQELATRFVDQVFEEFLSGACPRCQGRGYRGRQLDTVRHSLGDCPVCKGKGRIAYKATKTGKERYRICGRCVGKKLVTVSEQIKAGKLRACPSCHGTGKVQPSATARARALGCHRSHIYRVWNERFKAVLRELRHIERVALWTAEAYLT